MQHSENKSNGWRTGPTYTFNEAARLAGVSPATARRWVNSYVGPTGQMRPGFGASGNARDPSDGSGQSVSFLQLAEIVIAGQFLRKRATLERLRRAHQFARERFETEYPFASLRLKTDGVQALHQFQESDPGASLLILDLSGQLALPGGVVKIMTNFDFEDGLAARWFPMGRDVPIVIDPRYGAGRPTIPERRLTIETIHKRWLDGQDIDFIADDFDLERSLVEHALRYAGKFAA